MLQRYLKHPPPENNWTPFKDLLPLDFWVGSQYKGNYRNRLLLDLPGLEHVARFADLPPIVLRSDNWTPPAVNTPEMVAPGLSAFKKAAFQKNPDLPEEDQEYYRLTTTEVTYPGKDKQIPIGWVIHIKDRKLLHDYEQKHPQTTQLQKEEYFVQKLDKALREALVDITMQETFAVRTLDKPAEYKYVAWKAFKQMSTMWPTGFFSYHDLKTFAVAFFANNSILQEVSHLFSHATDAVIKTKIKKIGKNFSQYYSPPGNHKNASYNWRKQYFPNRIESEYENKDLGRQTALMAIPGNIFWKDFYAVYDALFRHKAPFIKLADATTAK